MEDRKPPVVDLANLRPWTFLTTHGRLLLAVAQNPEATVLEIANMSEITERTAYRILADLQKAGYVKRHKVGRRNRYVINRGLPLGDAVVENDLVQDLLQLIEDVDVEVHALSRFISPLNLITA